MPCPRQLESKLAPVGWATAYGLASSLATSTCDDASKVANTTCTQRASQLAGSRDRRACIAPRCMHARRITAPAALWAASRRPVPAAASPSRRAKARLACAACAPDTIQTAVEPDAAVRTRAALTRLICQFDRAEPSRAGREAVRAGGSQLAGGIGLDGDGIKMRDGRMPVLALTRASSLRRPRGWPAGSVSPSDWGICFRLPLLATRRDADVLVGITKYFCWGWGAVKS